MTAYKFERLGTPEGPGPIGRVVRFLAGVLFLALFIRTLSRYTNLVGFDVPGHPRVWVGTAVSFYFLSDLVNLGLARNWGRRPQVVAVLLALAAAVFDFSQYGSVWGPPLGFLVFLLLAYVTGHLGLSFIVAGIAGTPGGEMRAIPHVMGQMLGLETAGHTGQYGLTRLDRWEAGRKRQGDVYR